jgi:hypothetical protein
VNQADPRWAVVELGVQAERFLESALAQRMIFDAETERSALCEQIAALDIELEEDRAKFRSKQARIAALDCWQQFIADYIQRGQAAADALAAEDAPTGSEPLQLETQDG